jgi:hypothetical protein
MQLDQPGFSLLRVLEKIATGTPPLAPDDPTGQIGFGLRLPGCNTSDEGANLIDRISIQ